jgi:HK97 family phage major capsid protein
LTQTFSTKKEPRKMEMNEIISAMESMLLKAKAENRGFTADEETQYAALDASLQSVAQSPVPTFAGGKGQMVTSIKNREEDKPWANFGEQLMAVKAAATPGGSIDPRLNIKAAASGANESNPSDGGFLVMPEFSSEILKRAYETGVLASRVRKIPLTSGNGMKINGIDESSRANGSRWGGIQSYWENEADTATASKPKFRQMELSLNKLLGVCYATEELLQDAAALESVISQGFSEEFSFRIDDAIMNGSGAGQPLGFMKSGALVTAAKEAGQAAGTIKLENILKMWSRCWGRSRQNAIWLINQDIEPQLYTMSLAVGTGGVPVYMPANGVSGSPYSTLFGRPVVPIEQANTVGTTGDITLADLSQYLMLDKGSIKSDVSVHVRFLYDECTFKFTYRVDGEPMWNVPLTPFKGSNTLSPFVALQTRE